VVGSVEDESPLPVGISGDTNPRDEVKEALRADELIAPSSGTRVRLRVLCAPGVVSGR